MTASLLPRTPVPGWTVRRLQESCGEIVRSRCGAGVVLVTISLMGLALAGCEPIAPSASESTSNDDSVQSENPRSGSGLLLSEDSAISILQTYLQDCVLRWDTVYKARLAEREDSIALWGEMFSWTPPPPIAPTPSERVKMWLMDLAIRTNGEIVWSAKYHGVTELPNSFGRESGDMISSETWLVIGLGFKREGSDLETVPGRWKVYAGHREAFYLDAPARLALQEYNIYGACR